MRTPKKNSVSGSEIVEGIRQREELGPEREISDVFYDQLRIEVGVILDKLTKSSNEGQMGTSEDILAVMGFDSIRYIQRKHAVLFTASNGSALLPYCSMNGTANAALLSAFERELTQYIYERPGVTEKNLFTFTVLPLTPQLIRNILFDLTKANVVYVKVVVKRNESDNPDHVARSLGESLDAHVAKSFVGLDLLDRSRFNVCYFPTPNCIESLGTRMWDRQL